MSIKINMDALKDRLEGRKTNNNGGGNYPPRVNHIVKSEKGESIIFRPTVYPHSADPSTQPFAERSYHYKIGKQFVFYCPKQNDGQLCHICNFAWEMLKKAPTKEEKKKWGEFLPKRVVYIPGLVRGKESDGPKFIKFGTRNDKPSEHHAKFLKWLTAAKTCELLDPQKGRDVEIEYELLDESDARAKMFKTNVLLKDFQLDAAGSSEFSDTVDYEEFLTAIPNVDEAIYTKKTTEDSLKAVRDWAMSLGLDAESVSTETVVSPKKAAVEEESVIQASEEDIEFDQPPAKPVAKKAAKKVVVDTDEDIDALLEREGL